MIHPDNIVQIAAIFRHSDQELPYPEPFYDPIFLKKPGFIKADYKS